MALAEAATLAKIGLEIVETVIKAYATGKPVDRRGLWTERQDRALKRAARLLAARAKRA